MKNSKPAYRRHDIWPCWNRIYPDAKASGAALPRIIVVSSILYSGYYERGTMAGSSAGVRGLEQHAPPFHTLAGQGCLGEVTGDSD